MSEIPEGPIPLGDAILSEREETDAEVDERIRAGFDRITDERLERASLYEALATAQAHFDPIPRTKTVEVYSQRTGKTFTFTYAPLEVVLKACVPALNDSGFAFTQAIETDPVDKKDYVVSRLLHAFGEISNRVVMLPVNFENKEYGAAITYARRFGAQLLFGVSADDDNDTGEPAGQEGQHRAGGPAKAGKGREPRVDRSAAQQPEKVVQTQAQRATTLSPREEVKPPTDARELELAEGRIVDAMAEMIEACSEGRVVGIEQIWGEIRGEHFIADRVWNGMKDRYPDLFKTMKSVLRPTPDGARGPKAKAAP